MANRKKGDGCFKKLPNGTVEFSVELPRNIYGKRIRKCFYGKDEKECRKKYKEFLKTDEPTSVSQEHTLASWADKWLTTYKKDRVSEGTYDDYTGLVAHIKKHDIGNMKLCEVKPIHITGFFGDKIEYSHSFIKRMKFLLNAVFESAIDNDYCTKNPVRRAEIPKKTQGEKEAFTDEQVGQILSFAKNDNLFGLAITIMFNTGIRSGEMRALTTDKIDIKNRIITVDKAVKSNGKLGLTKSNKPRVVPLSSEFAAYLSEKLDHGRYYIVGNSSFVTKEGFRSRYHCFFNRLNKHLASIGKPPIERKSPHSTRHTTATLWHKSGMPLGIVSALLGHHSTEVTDKYTHVDDVTTLTQAIDKFEFPE